MGRQRKHQPGDRVWVPTGERGTVVPTWHDAPQVSVLLDHGDVRMYAAAVLKKIELLDRLAEATVTVDSPYKIGERIILPSKNGPIDSEVALVTIHGAVVLYDGERLVVAMPKS